MRLLYFIVLALLLTVLSPCALKAQEGRGKMHIEWIISVSKLEKGQALIVMNAMIDRGWHLYSTKMGEDGPVPTTVRFAPGAYRLSGEVEEFGMPVTVFDSTFQMNLTWYEDNVVFTQRVAYSAPGVIAGNIEFMVCSSELCIPGEISFRQSLP